MSNSDQVKEGLAKLANDEMDKLKEKIRNMESELSKFDKVEKEMKELREDNDKMKRQITEMVKKQDADKLMKMLKFDSVEMKNNGLDPYDGQKGDELDYFGRFSLTVTYSSILDEGWKCVRANKPVPKVNRNAKEKYIVFYFEARVNEIMENADGGVGIGFCSLHFPLEEPLGIDACSIGFTKKEGIDNGGHFIFTNDTRGTFKAGDKIGLALIYEPDDDSVKCHSICNRKLLGSVELSAKMLAVPVFPAVGLFERGNSISVNFGRDEWDFNPQQIIDGRVSYMNPKVKN